MNLPTSDRGALGLWLLAAALACGAVLLPPLAQPPAYHDFADQRACWAMPRCLDTASNALFVLAGGVGLLVLRRGAGAGMFRERHEALPYRLFFLGTVLVGFGSGYYHLAPDNDRLLWDRLAMMLAFMAWLAAILGERAGTRAALRLLPLLLAAGLGSVAWWGWSEARGIGDLRFYLLMQLIAVLLIPLLLRLYPPRYSGDRAILAVVGLYLLALLFDLGDRVVFEFTGNRVSGHTLKHVIAAAAVGVVVLHLRRRRAL